MDPDFIKRELKALQNANDKMKRDCRVVEINNDSSKTNKLFGNGIVAFETKTRSKDCKLFVMQGQDLVDYVRNNQTQRLNKISSGPV